MSSLNHYTIVINDKTYDDHAPGFGPEDALATYLDDLGETDAYLISGSTDEIIVTDNETGESWRMSGGCHVNVEHDWLGELL